jgi:hypothetical protein
MGKYVLIYDNCMDFGNGGVTSEYFDSDKELHARANLLRYVGGISIILSGYLTKQFNYEPYTKTNTSSDPIIIYDDDDI